MDVLDISRWQFGITTVYHFLFVPDHDRAHDHSIAVLETQWMRTGNPEYLRLTKFFGKLFLINFAIGLVTGIVQEFQFGMNWSDYSRFVGDIFGAPLAIEALLAFFLESRRSSVCGSSGGTSSHEKVHLGADVDGAPGHRASAYFILAANSWMQNPVGYTSTIRVHRAVPSSPTSVAVMFNKVQLVDVPARDTAAPG
jgi:cytochrome d ubiquinol oxidase subunit I